MCDYSLAFVNNRLAVEGEELILHEFYSGSKGFVSPAELSLSSKIMRGLKSLSDPCVVCIPPGAKLEISGIEEVARLHCKVKEGEEVIFTQTHMDANRHRDAVVFKNGRTYHLQHFDRGLRAKVLSLEGVTEREVVRELVYAR